MANPRVILNSLNTVRGIPVSHILSDFCAVRRESAAIGSRNFATVDSWPSPTQRCPPGGELAYLVRTSSQALAVIVLPLVFLALAAVGPWDLARALRTSSTVLIVTLAAIGYLGVRRARIVLRQKIVLMLVLVALGILVVLLELLAHG